MPADHAPHLARLTAVLATATLLITSAAAAAPASPALAAPAPEAPSQEAWNAHVQSTWIVQRKPRFDSAYSGAHSLRTSRESSYSFSATAAIGLRPWRGAELYLNPEAAQGVPLSGLNGLGGFSNGEMTRTSGSSLSVYRARLYLQQTWNRGGAREQVESDLNQLAGSVDRRRWVLTVGNLSLGDLFDDNRYSHDPRTQFLNLSFITHGAWDFAADARGYTWGLALAWYHDDWAVRAGRFAQPRDPNGQSLDPRLFRHYGDQIEIEHRHQLAGRPGAVRLLAFHNRARMSRYDDALAWSARSGSVPDLDAVRLGDRSKRGLGVNVEQALSDSIGLFGRASWADGKTETYAFTEIDRSISAGVVSTGQAWRRPTDSFGIALARNGLSRAHRDYLAAGGLGFFIGDGRLRYRPETIIELFYELKLHKSLAIALDWQRIRNPAYNADRGPVQMLAARVHVEF